MSDLFGKPADWRAPSKGEEPCQVCGSVAPHGTGNAFFCRAHVPTSYWPANRRDDPGDVL